MTDPLREWWDDLSPEEQWEAYRIEKSNAAALSTTPAPDPDHPANRDHDDEGNHV